MIVSSMVIVLTTLESFLLTLKAVYLVGETGIEPATPCTPCRCATKLRYSPTAEVG